jgi:hypothetical protein
MAVMPNLKELINQMPDADAHGTYCSDIDKEKVEKAIAEIAAGGADNIVPIIDMLGEPGSERDVKPHYALRCLGNRLLQAKDEAARRAFSLALASQLSSDRSKYIRGFLCQELQWLGRQEAIAALAKLLGDEELVDPAAMALVAIGKGSADALRAALPEAKGRCRLAILHSLAALADAKSVPSFAAALADGDREVRLAAGAGLAATAEASFIDALLKAADVSSGWERIQQTKHCIVFAERLAASGNKAAAKKVYSHLRQTRTDKSETYIREAAGNAAAALN